MNILSKVSAVFVLLTTIFIASNALAQTQYQLRKTSAEARNGSINVQDTAQGILISGTILGVAPKWPTSANQMAVSDHIEIWLADAEALHLPPTGWGNQIKEERIYLPEACDKLAKQSRSVCREWDKKQVKYRSQLIKLFVRQWQIAPNIVEETFATPAFQVLEKYKLAPSANNSEFTKTLAQKISPLKPSEKPIIRYFKQQQSGYTFEVLIPWQALPPVQRLALQRMRFVVDVFNPGKAALQYGPYSSTSSAHLYGDPNSFGVYQFKNPRNYKLTACQYNLRAANPHPSNIYTKDIYYFPKQEFNITKVIVLSNEVFGYQYEPDANSFSPIPFEVSFNEKNISDKEVICTNPLAYANQTNIVSKFNLNKDAKIEYKKLTNGNWLIKEGPFVAPFNPFGVGQCGACLNQVMNIYLIDQQNKKIDRVFHYEKLDDPMLGAKLTFNVDADWQKIKVIETKNNQSKELYFCFKHMKYIACE